ncbi:6-phosphogluconolactonase [Devosia lucknowensis]|uniref:6-phosphogluconolactonase n=1 Tax=Devosia lucknowensis TaxID=1096929 RepID=A0A1Y6GBC1_9HYPH|nr:beta-propeller fold lactonase family protein [Devosia lucknowensis]SMQ85767.1 6-phosphogluconolactonase [Devosia lucknowensis]
MTGLLLLTCNSRSATVSVHAYDTARGQVRHLRDVPLPVSSGETNAAPMTLGAGGTRVYLAWRGAEKRLFAFALDRKTGALILLQDHAIGVDVCFLHAPGDGTRLLAASGDTVQEFLLDREGRVAQTMTPLPLGPMAHCAIADSLGRIYATACRGDLVRSFTVDSGLVHVEDIPQPAGSGPRHLCLSPDGTSLYLVTQESGEVVVFSTTGGLREIQRLVMVEGAAAPMGGDIGVTPDGRFVYATERSTNQVVGFAVDDGRLRRIGAAPVADYPRALGIGGGGAFLVVLGFRGHRADIFGIAENGSLTPIADYETGERPSWVLAVDAA